MAHVVPQYVDLTTQSEDDVGAVNLGTINDLLLTCDNPAHVKEGITVWDQILSAMASMLKWAPPNTFRSKLALCDCPVANKAMRVQTITFLGLAGFLCVAKEITTQNKVYVAKRWSAYCAGAGVANMLTEAKMNTLTTDVIDVQPRLYQTALGRAFATKVLESEMTPIKSKNK